MNLFAIVLILISAAMHAGWNFLCKAKAPSAAFFTVATVASVVAMLPLFAYFAPSVPAMPLPIWGLVLATGFCHALYFVSLANAYRLHDISFVYPLARALPVLMVPLVCAVLGYGKTLSATALGGMTITALGCLVLPLQSLKASFFRQYFHRAIWFVLATAAGTTGYTILDSLALEQLKRIAPSLSAQPFSTPPFSTPPFSALDAALFLSAFQNLFMLLFLVPYVLMSRTETHHYRTLIRHSPRFPIGAGLICTIAYTLVLFAMQFASNVSYVVAFRQSSILFGFLLGILLLKEKATAFKISGVLLIFAGLVLAALG